MPERHLRGLIGSRGAWRVALQGRRRKQAVFNSSIFFSSVRDGSRDKILANIEFAGKPNLSNNGGVSAGGTETWYKNARHLGSK